MRKFDDSDMKIAGDDFSSEAVDGADVSVLLEQERENGNLDKARRLGSLLAGDVVSIEDAPGPANGAAENPELPLQRRILLAFAAEVGLEMYLPNQLVAGIAQNTFYHLLDETTPAFYDTLQNSGAFSFYYLCVREGKNVEKKVGETFATLCGMADSQSYARMGKELYIRFIGQIRGLAESLAFV